MSAKSRGPYSQNSENVSYQAVSSRLLTSLAKAKNEQWSCPVDRVHAYIDGQDLSVAPRLWSYATV